MSLNIKKPEAHALAEHLAKLTGETLTDAVTVALRERLARLEQKPDFDEALYEKLKAIAAGSRKLMKEPYLSMEHGDLLYDERGLPK
ncbi:MAG: type II toxin-antitoxin system VapB family antitoxin [Hyphomicrobiales bacterium]|nr:type II toxin-antitoxin system VapB family antitoxin [Hyphomicrobiales bacterium]MBV9907522.1 type II toxin-antitoxin system VapB family antitoxin [Hyphomicrobiales bacterium]